MLFNKQHVWKALNHSNNALATSEANTIDFKF